jgi:hypothetical protein
MHDRTPAVGSSGKNMRCDGHRQSLLPNRGIAPAPGRVPMSRASGHSSGSVVKEQVALTSRISGEQRR